MTITSTQQAAEIVLQILKQRKTAFRKLKSSGMKESLLNRDVMVIIYLNKIIAGDTESWKIRQITKAKFQIEFLISYRRKNTKLKKQQLELHRLANDYLRTQLV